MQRERETSGSIMADSASGKRRLFPEMKSSPGADQQQEEPGD